MVTHRKNNRTLIVSVFLISLFSLGIAYRAEAAPFNDGFASAVASQYIPTYKDLKHDLGFEKVPSMQGKYCMRLRNENQTDAKFALQPLVAGQQYEVRFRSLFANEETLETNPTLEETTRPGWKYQYRHLPTFEIVFLDQDQNPQKKTTTVALPYGHWHQYQTLFTAPLDAAFVQFVFSSGINNGILYIDDIRFAADARTQDK